MLEESGRKREKRQCGTCDWLVWADKGASKCNGSFKMKVKCIKRKVLTG